MTLRMKAIKKVEKAKEYCRKNGISENNPDLLYLVLGELRSANFRLAVLLGTNGVLIALVLAVLLR